MLTRQRILLALLVLPAVFAVLPEARSMPILMDRYDEHPQSLPEYRGRCVICHKNADGSGELTPFGDKYDRANLRFTAELVAANGNLFQGGAAPPEGEDVFQELAALAVVPGNEPWNAKRYYREECKKCHGRYGEGDPFQGVPAFATRKWIDERSARTDELLHIILNGKDKMIGHAGKITEDEARELLEGVRIIANKYVE